MKSETPPFPAGNPEDPDPWAALAGRALWSLEHPDQIPPLERLDGRTLLLRLWRYRRWSPHRAWGIFTAARTPADPLVREVRWNAVADLRRMTSSVQALKRRSSVRPSLRVRDAVVGAPRIGPFLEEAPRILPIARPSPRAGLRPLRDVVGIEGYRSLTPVRVEWEERSPDVGPAVRAWVARLQALLESALRERETA